MSSRDIQTSSSNMRKILQEHTGPAWPKTSFDYYSNHYGREISDVNVYYRSIIEDMDVKFKIEVLAKEDIIKKLRTEVERLTKDFQVLVRDFEGKLEKLVTDRDTFKLRVVFFHV